MPRTLEVRECMFAACAETSSTAFRHAERLRVPAVSDVVRIGSVKPPPGRCPFTENPTITPATEHRASGWHDHAP